MLFLLFSPSIYAALNPFHLFDSPPPGAFYPFHLCDSPPPGSSEARLDEDDVHVLAPTRVLLGIALGLARAGLIADATKELVKAAAVRPRCDVGVRIVTCALVESIPRILCGWVVACRPFREVCCRRGLISVCGNGVPLKNGLNRVRTVG